MSNEDEFPMLLYVYGHDGMHGEPIKIVDNETLLTLFETIVAQAVAQRREVVITDMADDCLFHSRDGEVLWAGGASPDATS